MKRVLTKLLAGILLVGQILSLPLMTACADSSANVVTLGENLSEEQKQSILDFFGVSEGSVEIVYVTNADERELLSGHYTDEEIGTKTYSCAYIHITSSGGIQAKIGNLNRVTSADIAQMLALSGVYNCEVLTAAPFEVSGTGALTGVMMAYEQASDVQLDPVKKDVAVKAIETKEKITDTVGKEEATLVVNDIAIHIIRDNVKDENAVVSTVDEVVQTTQSAMEERAQLMGAAPSGLIGQTEKEVLYDFGRKLAETDYDYEAMKPTLQRVTRTTAQNTGIDDPLVGTFDSSDLVALPADSILRGGDDEAMGDIIVNSTADTAVSSGEVISLTTDSVELVSSGQCSYEEMQAACNTSETVSAQEYSLRQDGDKSSVVEPDGTAVLDVSAPYIFEDIIGDNILLGFDENYEEEDVGEAAANTEAEEATNQASGEEDTDIIPIIIPDFDIQLPTIDDVNTTYKYGIADIEGNILVSCAFDKIYSTNHHPWSDSSGTIGYGDFGYFPVVYEGTFGYVSSAGEITCLTDIELDPEMISGMITDLGGIYSSYDIGCSARYLAEDGTICLIAADGIIAELGSSEDIYSVYPLDYAGGALWEVTLGGFTGESYLTDWHGNVLMKGYGFYYISTDGKTLYVPVSAGYDRYEIQYLGSLAGSGSVQGQEQTGQAPDQAVQGDGGTPVQENADAAAPAASAKDLLEQAAALISEDMVANQESILSLLRSAKTELDAQNPDAASPVNSVIVLLESGATDATAVSTLIDAALGAL